MGKLCHLFWGAPSWAMSRARLCPTLSRATWDFQVLLIWSKIMSFLFESRLWPKYVFLFASSGMRPAQGERMVHFLPGEFSLPSVSDLGQTYAHFLFVSLLWPKSCHTVTTSHTKVTFTRCRPLSNGVKSDTFPGHRTAPCSHHI